MARKQIRCRRPGKKIKKNEKQLSSVKRFPVHWHKETGCMLYFIFFLCSRRPRHPRRLHFKYTHPFFVSLIAPSVLRFILFSKCELKYVWFPWVMTLKIMMMHCIAVCFTAGTTHRIEYNQSRSTLSEQSNIKQRKWNLPNRISGTIHGRVF